MKKRVNYAPAKLLNRPGGPGRQLRDDIMKLCIRVVLDQYVNCDLDRRQARMKVCGLGPRRGQITLNDVLDVPGYGSPPSRWHLPGA